MTGLRYAAHVLATSGAGPVEVIRGLNQIMLEHGHPGDIEIANVVHAQLDTATGRLTSLQRRPPAPDRPRPFAGDPRHAPPRSHPRPPAARYRWPALGVRAEVDHLEQHTDLGSRWALIGFTETHRTPWSGHRAGPQRPAGGPERPAGRDPGRPPGDHRGRLRPGPGRQPHRRHRGDRPHRGRPGPHPTSPPA